MAQKALAIVPAASDTGVEAIREGRADVARPETGDGVMEADAQELEETVPVEWLWLMVKRRRSETNCKRLTAYSILVVTFTAAMQMVRPVRATFTVQDSLLEHIAREPFPQASWAKTFYDISNEADWFEWVETVLVPATMSDTYFNGDRRAQFGSRFLNTVSMYNTQTAPMRFRQARVTDDSCDLSDSSSQLARPCWGAFSASRQFRQGFGTEYGNRYLKGLNSIGGKEGFGVNYGTEAHVVDAELNKERTLNLLSQMKSGLWINEQTRAVSVETNWYNANLDISTYCMWHIDITPGGHFQPYVVIHSCRLSPYSVTMDYVRLGFEVIFVFFLVGFLIIWFRELRRSGDKKAYLMSPWNLLELLNLLSFVLVLIFWLVYLAQDKAPFRALSSATGDDRPNLSSVATNFNLGVNFAAFNIIFSYIKVFKLLQILPSVEMLWRTLELSVVDMFAFLCVFFLFICGFTFAGHWIFGFRMIEFHNWGDSFITLFQSFMGGLPYETMSQFAPVSAALFTLAWVLMMAVVIAVMFVAILTHWYFQAVEEKNHEEERLSQRARPTGHFLPFRDQLAKTAARTRRGPRAAADDEVEQILSEAYKDMKHCDLRDVEHIRKALATESDMTVRDLTRSFHGDERHAANFVKKVCHLANTDKRQRDNLVHALSRKEVEAQEQDRLQKLQVSMQRLEDHVKKLRGALHETSVGRLVEGQSMEGYTMEAPPLPGAVMGT